MNTNVFFYYNTFLREYKHPFFAIKLGTKNGSKFLLNSKFCVTVLFIQSKLSEPANTNNFILVKEKYVREKYVKEKYVKEKYIKITS